MGMNPAIFLDRDGVLIDNNPNYIRSWSDVLIFPQALKALGRIDNDSYKIVIITNQSAVGRGLISYQIAEDINVRLIEKIHLYGGKVDGIYMCPHHPEDNCTCRKPKPGLIIQAAKELELDLEKSLLIGDALTDIIAGQEAGIPTNVLILTGRGKDQALLIEDEQKKSILIYKDLAEALAELLSSSYD